MSYLGRSCGHAKPCEHGLGKVLRGRKRFAVRSQQKPYYHGANLRRYGKGRTTRSSQVQREIRAANNQNVLMRRITAYP
jgi:hypothetical protein